MGSSGSPISSIQEMSANIIINSILILIILAFGLHQARGIFLSTPTDECRGDYDCPRLGNRRGKCIKDSVGLFCGLLNPSRVCSYTRCAECHVDRDCEGYAERLYGRGGRGCAICVTNRCGSTCPNPATYGDY